VAIGFNPKLKAYTVLAIWLISKAAHISKELPVALSA